MHARILLPSLFAATLLSTAALAERTDHEEGAPIRASSVKERVVRESRAPEARERVQHKDTTAAKPVKERAAPARLQEKRGCSTDDGSGCRSKSDPTAKTVAKSKASMPSMPARLQAQRGCTTDDGSGCSGSSKADASTKQTQGTMDSKHLVAKTDRWSKPITDEMMKMRLKIETDRILDMLMIATCQRNGNCGEDAF